MSVENSPKFGKYVVRNTERLRFVGSICTRCGNKHFPIRIICPDCGHTNKNNSNKVEGPKHNEST